MRNLALCLVWLIAPTMGACGQAKDLNADAPPGPAIDAPPPIDGATHGAIGVTTLDYNGNNAPVAGVAVVFYSPAGAVTGETTSDANGKARGEIDVGGSVVAVYVTGPQHTVLTIQDVHPGDNLTFGITTRDQMTDGMFAVTFPPYPGATSYRVYGPCGSQTGTPNVAVVMPFLKHCKPDTFDVYVVASAANGVVATAEALDVARSSNGVSLVNVWTGGISFTAGYNNFDPTALSNLRVEHLSGTGANGYSTGASVAANESAATIPNTVRAGKYAFVRSSFTKTIGSPTQTFNNQAVICQRINGKSGGYDLDIDGRRMPWLTSITYDPSAHTFTSTTEHDIKPSVALWVLAFSASVGGGASYQYLTLGPSATNGAIPVLPAHFMAVYPTATSAYQAVEYALDSTDQPDWDANRQSPIDVYLSILTCGTTGTARTSLIVNNHPAAP